MEPRHATMLRPLGVGEILDVTFRLYRENFLPFVRIAAIGVIPTQLLTLLVLLSAAPDDGIVVERTDIFGNTTTDVDTGQLWRFLAAIVLTSIVAFLATLIVSAAITRAVAHSYVDGRRPDVSESLKFALRRLLPLVGMTILFALGVMLGTVACIIPGVFLYVAWSVAAPALIMEGAGPAGALGRSLRLVRPRWWPTFGLLLLVFLMTSIASQIIQIPITLPFGGGGGFFGTVDPDDLTRSLVASTVAGIVTGLLTEPFAAIVNVVLYVDLRVRHEGFDVQVLARSIGTEAPPAAPTPRPEPPRPPVPPPPPPPQWGTPPPPPSG
jgi:hypothetical protein